jgi:hypothetical protein
MNGIFANYLWTMFWGSVFWIFWIMWFFSRKYKYRCIRVYVWFKDECEYDWYWKISAYSTPNFIFWLGMLIFSVSSQWGSPIPFPTGGACVLSVIRFQDGGRRSAVVKAEARIWSTTPKCIDKRSKNWLDWKVHITPKTHAYDLCSLLFNIIVFVECPSCPDWK